MQGARVRLGEEEVHVTIRCIRITRVLSSVFTSLYRFDQFFIPLLIYIYVQQKFYY